MGNCTIPDKEVLIRKYIDEEKPMHKIAEELHMSVGKIHKFIKLYEIPTRKTKDVLKGRHLTQEQCMRISAVNKGKKLSEETKAKISASHKVGGIGSKKKRSDGYICVYFPDHPCSTKDGYIMEHVLVMESLIGRHLTKDECVHHKNRIKSDNRKENLQLMTKSEHMSLHSKERWEAFRNAQ
ncbi:MAG: HNH endonuclease [Clostridia bacterium]|nr:HNH endonuclease [Clostridia bacterium]